MAIALITESTIKRTLQQCADTVRMRVYNEYIDKMKKLSMTDHNLPSDDDSTPAQLKLQ